VLPPAAVAVKPDETEARIAASEVGPKLLFDEVRQARVGTVRIRVALDQLVEVRRDEVVQDPAARVAGFIDARCFSTPSPPSRAPCHRASRDVWRR
jgi:hypothetical protein